MTEAQIQKAVFGHIRNRAAPGVIAWHVNNGPEARRKSGFLAGVPDVSIVKGREFFALELKTEKGVISDEQERIVRELNEALGPGKAYIARGLDDALAWLEVQGIIRRAT